MMSQEDLRFGRLASPLGELLLLASEEGLTGLYLPGHLRGPQESVLWKEGGSPHLHQAAVELGEYFAGERRAFTVPLDLRGPEFHRQVWDLLVKIPWGATRTYGDLARDLGRTGGARAVGAASARNPVSIIVPCHRLVGSSGSLTGYAGGLDRKAWLLRHESPQQPLL